MKISKKRKIGLILLSLVMGACVTAAGCSAAVSGYENSGTGSTLTNLTNKNVSGTQYYGSIGDVAASYASEYIMVRNKPMAGSFYAYTEGITDDMAGLEADQGNEAIWWPDSSLVKLSYNKDTGEFEEEELLKSKDGVIRDPDVSPDGTKVVFSWKTSKDKDDYHLYIYDLKKDTYDQITFGQGISDTEPKWLPNGQIAFSSSRIIQVVDCWHTPVSNIFVCNADGSDMIRLGYDQVHTTYPTVTEDGRILYTRWDYNDRTQMFVQALFSMNTDGTGQTAVFGNNSNNPTTLMHTVGVPGSPEKYLTIVSGHHVVQGGKLAWIDTSVDRDGKDPLTYVREIPSDNGESVDELGAQGVIYRYPYAINEYEMFYAKAPQWGGNKDAGAANTKFNYYYYNARTGEETLIADCGSGNTQISCSQLIPIRTRNMIARPSTVDYSQKTGTYYVANVYEGEQVANVKFGDAKWLRVVALDYRPYAIGGVSAGNQGDGLYHDGYGASDPCTPVGTANSTWDIKQVLGIVPIESDGSVMFEVPSDLPVYFQLLDKDGMMIQSMRSWSTLMPGETFSCVGCHESKNEVPTGAGNVTLALKKGTQQLQKDLWMTTEDYEDYDPYTDYKGFSYTQEIQPILDNSCVVCHTNQDEAYRRIGGTGATQDFGETINNTTWKYKITTKNDVPNGWTSASFTAPTDWLTGTAPFGGEYGTGWGDSADACFYMTQKFNVSAAQLANGKFFIEWQYDEDPIVYVNGHMVIDYSNEGGKYNDSTWTGVNIPTDYLNEDENVVTARAYNAVGGSLMNIHITCNTGASEAQRAVSLQDAYVDAASRDRVDYLLSYLVLTNSYLARKDNPNEGKFYAANMDENYGPNNICNWIGGMSEPHSIPAYKYGATQSNLIQMFYSSSNVKNQGNFDHTKLFTEEGWKINGTVYKITKDELMRLSAWIDLGVPYRGTYDEATENWGSDQMAERDRRQNMRDYYTKIDELNKAKLAGEWTTKRVKIEYYDKDGDLIYTVNDRHLSILNLDQKVQPGDKVVVTLPRGTNYIWFNFNPKMELSLQYCPNGVFTYIVPSYAEYVLPNLTVDRTQGSSGRKGSAQENQYTYNHLTITAFIPTDEEIYGTTYNVALNPYDVPYNYNFKSSDKYYFDYVNYNEDTDGEPMITAGSTWEGNSFGNFCPNNAFDGSTNNRGEGAGNMDQSWGPSLYKDNRNTNGEGENPDNLWLKVDFGREVELEYFVMYIRGYDLDNHDVWLNKLEITYGNGQTIEWDLSEVEHTHQAQTLKLDSKIKTTYLTIKITEKAREAWCGITEFEAYGRNVAK